MVVDWGVGKGRKLYLYKLISPYGNFLVFKIYFFYRIVFIFCIVDMRTKQGRRDVQQSEGYDMKIPETQRASTPQNVSLCSQF